MKVFVLAPKEDWICDRLAEEWKSKFNSYVVDLPESADVLWLLAGWCWNHIHPSILEKKKVVLTVHHIVPEKFTNKKYQEFVFRDQFVDVYHVPNIKTASLLSQITKKPIKIISYWLNDDLWKPFSKNKAKKILGLSLDEFHVSSIQRDTEGYDLKTPKLEKGPDIFCDYLIEHQDKFENLHVLLGGWRRQYVQSRLEAAKIPYTLFEKDSIEKVRMIYASTDLYIVSSRQEGGPQAVIECAAMNIPIISTDVGISREVLSKDCVFDIASNFYLPKQKDVETNFENVQKLRLELHGKEFIKLFEFLKG
jgi:glycosyltransferase involved in cell wall biosynthesis